MGRRPEPARPERVERLYMLMNREGLSITKFAKKIGTSQQHMSEVLISKKISDYYVDKVRKVFPNYLTEWLLGDGDPKIATRDDLMKEYGK